MGKWDVVLPFLAPRGATPEPPSRRARASSRSRSRSVTSSEASDELPGVEEIYDLRSQELVELEEKLSQKSSLNSREEKLHRLIKVELSERRNVEEIGLAILGGRFDLEAVAAPVPAVPAEVWTLPDASPRSSSSLVRTSPRLPTPSPSSAVSPSRPERVGPPPPAFVGPSGPARPSRPFKPTPVDFDFVIASSSVKTRPRKPKPKEDAAKSTKKKGSGAKVSREPKKDLPASKDKAPKGYPKPQPNAAACSRDTREEMAPQAEARAARELEAAAEDVEPVEKARVQPGESSQPDRKEMEGRPDDQEELDQVVEQRGAEEQGHDLESSTAFDSKPVRRRAKGTEQQMDKVDSQELAHEQPGMETPPESVQELEAGVEHRASEAPDQAEAETSLGDPGWAGMEARPISRTSCQSASDVLSAPGPRVACSSEPSGSPSACSVDVTQGDEDALDPLEDASAGQAFGLEHGQDQLKNGQDELLSEDAELEDDPEPEDDVPVEDAQLVDAQVEDDAQLVDDAQLEEDAQLEDAQLEDARDAQVDVQPDSQAEDAQADPAAQAAQPGPLMSPKPHEPEKVKVKPRKPPLPQRLEVKSTVARVNEFDYLGLDPGMVERGEITSYQETFASFTDIFNWSQADAAQKERYLREALQVFSQFCNIIGSLETQFVTKLPAEHATPNATHQVLNAMASRGAGLYGVFLKGIIDKMDAVPRPIPEETQHDVYSLRYYKVVQNRTEVYDIVTRMFHRKEGWEELPHGLGLSNVWNLMWTWSNPKLDYSRLCVWQKVNHFPNNKHLTRKDCLKRCIDRYTRTGSKVAQSFNICPQTFVLPKEYCNFIESFQKIEEENEDDPNMWILKPAGSSRGRGIEVVNDIGAVHYGELTIIQQYISDPYLLGGFKWDMRTYVTVTSFNPLEAFIYRDGFARFTTVPYNTSNEDIDNKFVHLTNSSIQRHNEESFMEEGDNLRREDAILGGTKISFTMLKDRLKAKGVEWSVLWGKMIEVVLKSLCMAEDHIPSQVNAFELFGYDLMMDSKFKVWLIEVNSSPSMGQEHLLDEHVKQPLINDTIDLVDPLPFDRRCLSEVLQRRVERKARSGQRQQLDLDLHAVLKGRTPRKYGEMPEKMGNYERIAPSPAWDSIVKSRTALFNRSSPS